MGQVPPGFWFVPQVTFGNSREEGCRYRWHLMGTTALAEAGAGLLVDQARERDSSKRGAKDDS